MAQPQEGGRDDPGASRRDQPTSGPYRSRSHTLMGSSRAAARILGVSPMRLISTGFGSKRAPFRACPRPSFRNATRATWRNPRPQAKLQLPPPREHAVNMAPNDPKSASATANGRLHRLKRGTQHHRRPGHTRQTHPQDGCTHRPEERMSARAWLEGSREGHVEAGRLRAHIKVRRGARTSDCARRGE